MSSRLCDYVPRSDGPACISLNIFFCIQFNIWFGLLSKQPNNATYFLWGFYCIFSTISGVQIYCLFVFSSFKPWRGFAPTSLILMELKFIFIGWRFSPLHEIGPSSGRRWSSSWRSRRRSLCASSAVNNGQWYSYFITIGIIFALCISAWYLGCCGVKFVHHLNKMKIET